MSNTALSRILYPCGRLTPNLFLTAPEESRAISKTYRLAEALGLGVIHCKYEIREDYLHIRSYYKNSKGIEHLIEDYRKKLDLDKYKPEYNSVTVEEMLMDRWYGGRYPKPTDMMVMQNPYWSLSFYYPPLEPYAPDREHFITTSEVVPVPDHKKLEAEINAQIDEVLKRERIKLNRVLDIDRACDKVSAAYLTLIETLKLVYGEQVLRLPLLSKVDQIKNGEDIKQFRDRYVGSEIYLHNHLKDLIVLLPGYLESTRSLSPGLSLVSETVSKLKLCISNYRKREGKVIAEIKTIVENTEMERLQKKVAALEELLKRSEMVAKGNSVLEEPSAEMFESLSSISKTARQNLKALIVVSKKMPPEHIDETKEIKDASEAIETSLKQLDALKSTPLDLFSYSKLLDKMKSSFDDIDRTLKTYLPELYKLGSNIDRMLDEIKKFQEKYSKPSPGGTVFLPGFTAPKTHKPLSVTTPALEECDVPADGTCLFYSVAFAYLLPVLRNVEQFNVRYTKLFGEEVLGSAEENRKRLLEYRGDAKFINTHSETFEVLVNHYFRQRVVAFMRHKDNRADFENFIKTEAETFESRMTKMEDPIRKEWGDEPEVAAVSRFLEVHIIIQKRSAADREYGLDYHARQITLVHSEMTKGSGRYNHYQFKVDAQYLNQIAYRPSAPHGAVAAAPVEKAVAITRQLR